MIFTTLMAASTLILADGQQMATDISLSNPTRILFEDDRPTQLIFNEADKNAPQISATLGGSGDIFISVEQGLIGQTISGFITTESGKTYPVKFKISNLDTPQTTVASADLRREAQKLEDKKKAAKVEAAQTVEWSRASTYQSSLSQLIVALYHDQAPEGFAKTRSFERLPSIAGLKSKVEDNYKAANVIARRIELTNTSSSVIYVPNILPHFKGFLALSYSSESLNPGQSGYLYIVEKRTAL